jgi:DNA-binding XRE family transcriptional regulator
VHKLSRLVEHRKRRMLTQEELAGASSVGRTTIAALERGYRGAHPSTARKLAKVLKVKPEDVVGEEERSG